MIDTWFVKEEQISITSFVRSEEVQSYPLNGSWVWISINALWNVSSSARLLAISFYQNEYILNILFFYIEMPNVKERNGTKKNVLFTSLMYFLLIKKLWAMWKKHSEKHRKNGCAMSKRHSKDIYVARLLDLNPTWYSARYFWNEKWNKDTVHKSLFIIVSSELNDSYNRAHLSFFGANFMRDFINFQL